MKRKCEIRRLKKRRNYSFIKNTKRYDEERRIDYELEEDLKTKFSTFGEIEKADLVRDKRVLLRYLPFLQLTNTHQCED